MSFGLGFWAAAGGVAAATDYELIQTVNITTGGVTTISLGALGTIPQTYKHLQMRFTYQVNTGSSSQYQLVIAPNGDGSTSDNAFHWLLGDGSTVRSQAGSNVTATRYGLINYPQTEITGGNITPSSFQSQFVGGIVDFLDYSSTTKNKTIRAFSGHTIGGTNNVTLASMLYSETTAINAIFMYAANAPAFTVGSRFSLYGIKG
jgi:hypothetical protein